MEIDFTNPEILKERRVKKDRENNKKNSTKFKNIKRKKERSKSNVINGIEFKFKGNGREFFEVWIFNILITLLTFGLFSNWANINIRKYICEKIYLDKYNLSYNIKISRLIIKKLTIILFYLTLFTIHYFYKNQLLDIILLTTALLVAPLAILEIIKLKFEGISYREIDFYFKTEVSKFYILIIFSVSILIMVSLFVSIFLNLFKDNLIVSSIVSSLGFIFIYVILYKKYKEFTLKSLYYGISKFQLDISFLDTLFAIIKAWSLSILSILSVISIIFIILYSVNLIFKIDFIYFLDLDYILKSPLLLVIFIIFEVAILNLAKGIYEGYMLNFIVNNITLDNIGKFESKISPIKFGFICLTNSLIVIFTLGIFYPYARVRYLRERVESISFICDISCNNLDEFLEFHRKNSEELAKSI